MPPLEQPKRNHHALLLTAVLALVLILVVVLIYISVKKMGPAPSPSTTVPVSPTPVNNAYLLPPPLTPEQAKDISAGLESVSPMTADERKKMESILKNSETPPLTKEQQEEMLRSSNH